MDPCGGKAELRRCVSRTAASVPQPCSPESGLRRMRHQRLLLFLSAVVSVTLWTYACGDGTTEPTPYSSEPTTITVSPATAELVALDADGTDVRGSQGPERVGDGGGDGDVGEQRHRRGDRRRVRAGDGCGQRDRHDHGDLGPGFGNRDGDRGAGGQLCDGGAGGGELCGSGRHVAADRRGVRCERAHSSGRRVLVGNQ